MKQVYRYYITDPTLDIRVTFFLNRMGRISQIIWSDDKKNFRERIYDRKNMSQEESEDLTREFKKLALGNPEEFKTLYYVLKKNDPGAFPYIQEAREQTLQLFDFK